MLSTILASSIPAKGKILKLLNEVKKSGLETNRQHKEDEQCEQYGSRKRIINKMRRAELYVGILIKRQQKMTGLFAKDSIITMKGSEKGIHGNG